jgi:phage tail sheath gpL-like
MMPVCLALNSCSCKPTSHWHGLCCFTIMVRKFWLVLAAFGCASGHAFAAAASVRVAPAATEAPAAGAAAVLAVLLGQEPMLPLQPTLLCSCSCSSKKVEPGVCYTQCVQKRDDPGLQVTA